MIKFHEFTLGDVDDPEIYAAQPILDWEHSEHGQWCMQHSTIPVAYRISTEFDTWQYRVVIYGDLSPSDLTFYNLKWSNK